MAATPSPAGCAPGRRRPAGRRGLVQQANLLTSDKVAAMFVFDPVSPLVTRAEVNYPPKAASPT
jgi:hypothetical protein